MANLLIVDDEEGYCSVLKVVFEKEGYQVETCNDGGSALGHIKANPCDLLISDVRMPDMDGIALLKAAREFSEDIKVILITAFGTIATAREAFKLGADDFIQKPFQNDELKLIVKRTLENQAVVRENQAFRRAQRMAGGIKNLVGSSPKMLEIHKMIETVAPETSAVLITGESGTGKELVARAIHDSSPRANKPFIPINCSAIPEHLLEAELFGFVKGTFTGATADRTGLFEAADGGTILLDEIGDMSPTMQVKLLRVLQDKRVRPVGATREIPFDVRIIAATNCDINQKVEDGSFRRDSYYRLAVMPIDLPPLRERLEDISGLTGHFLHKFGSGGGKKLRVSDAAFEALRSRTWDGNVRELEHVIERAVAVGAGGDEILPEHILSEPQSKLNDSFKLPAEGLHLPTLINDMEKAMVEEAIGRTGGNQTQAASLLQIPVHAFRHLLTKHKIKPIGDKEKTAESSG